MQASPAVCQNAVDPADLSTASATALFTQMFGGAIWLSVAQALFANRLIKSLESVPGVDAHAIFAAGATAIRSEVAPKARTAVIGSYLNGLKDAYILCIALGGSALVVTVLITIFSRRKMRQTGSPTVAVA